MIVELKQKWQLERKLGQGGGGAVYLATTADGDQAAIKLVEKVPGADRELLMVDVGGRPNVVPVVEHGETSRHFVLRMPVAKKSLSDHLVNGPLKLREAIDVLLDVAEALEALSSVVVHRDLKPANVMLLDGSWCVADFGIARYVDAATASKTLKRWQTSEYAAPERWRNETATPAADIYSLGVMAYEMVVGSRPFVGSVEDLRDAHLHHAPPAIAHVPPAFASLIDEMMQKAPEARPDAASVMRRLWRQQERIRLGDDGLSALEVANRRVVREKVEEEAAADAAFSAQVRKRELRQAGANLMQKIRAEVLEALTDAAPAAEVETMPSGWSLSLNDAILVFRSENIDSHHLWAGSTAPFGVVEIAEIGIRLPPTVQGYEGRSHSLWYCDAQRANQYKWYETAFMDNSPRRQGSKPQEPFSLPPDGDAARALSNVVTTLQLAWPFEELILGELDSFVSRWGSWFGQAASGLLTRPPRMPERRVDGSWRANGASSN